MKKLPILCVLLFSLLALSPAALGNSFSLGTWNASGSQVWRTTFPLHKDAGTGASELYYPKSGQYITASIERQLSNQRLLTVEGGIIGSINKGVGSDSDWDYTLSPILWFYGEFATGGKNYYLSVNWKQPVNSHTQFFYGYSYQFNHYSMTDGLYLIEDYDPVFHLFPNLNSYYTMIYHGPYAGISYYKPVAKKLSAFANLSYTPLALAQGHGWWNLRNLHFEHVGPAQMFNSQVGVDIQLSSSSILSLGYRYQHNRIFAGRESSNSTISWAKASTTQKGFYFTGKHYF